MSLFGIGLDKVVDIGANILGGIFGKNSAESAADSQFQHQLELMERQNQYNVENYKHRHQWEVEDLRAAGLNPILSANSAANVASVSSGNAAMADPASSGEKMTNLLKNLAFSALDIERKKVQNDEVKAGAEQTKADAEFAKVESETFRNVGEGRYFFKQMEMADKNYALQKAYTEAQISKTNQDIINSISELAGKLKLMERQGEAALMMGSAAQESAHAASLSARANMLIAEVAEKNGVSERVLKDALTGKATAETREAVERALSVAQGRQITEKHNPIGTEWQNASPASILTAVGEILRNGIGGNIPFSK